MTTLPMSYLKDLFDDASIAATWGTAFTVIGSATRAETGGQLVITLPSSVAGTHEAGIQSAHLYDLTNDQVTIKVGTMVSTAVAASATLYLFDSADPTSWLRILQVGGTLYFQKSIAGSATTIASVTWNASTHAYWKIRESAGTIYFDTSSNSTSWTNRASVTVALSMPINATIVRVEAICGNVASPGTFKIDELNAHYPALTTNWHWTQVEWPLLYRFRTVTLATTGGQGYMATSNDGTTWAYYSGPLGSGSGGYNQLTLAASQAAAQAQAVTIPDDGRWDLPSIVECRYIRLYHRSTSGSTYTLQEYYPRRLVQADDIEAESIRAINIGAGQVTADKIFVLSLAALSASMGALHMDGVIDIESTGGIYQGSGTFATPTTGLKLFNSGGVGKLSGYNAGVEQITLDTDGKLKAGAGAVLLDADGIEIVGPVFSWDLTNGSPVTLPRENMLQWSKASGGQAASIVGSSTSQLLLLADEITLAVPLSSTVSAGLAINSSSAVIENVSSFAVRGDNLGSADFEVTTALSAASSVTSIRGGLNLGSASGASTGQISTSGSIGVGEPVNSVTRLHVKGASSTSSDYAMYVINSSAQAMLAIRNDNRIGFFGATEVARPTVTGSRAGNAALASVLTALANLGLITDSSS